MPGAETRWREPCSALETALDRIAFISLTMMAVLIPIESLTAFLAGRTLAWALGVVAAGAFAVRSLLKKELPRIDRKVALPAAIWLLWGCASILWAADKTVAFHRAQILAQGMVFLFLIQAVLASPKRFTRLVQTYVAAVGVTAIAAIVIAYVNGLQRVVFSDAQCPIDLAQSLGVGLVMIPFLVDRSSRKTTRFGLFLCANVSALAVVLTGARGAWLALCGAIVAVLLLTKGRGLHWRRTLIPTVIVGLQLFLIVQCGGLPGGEGSEVRASTFTTPYTVEGSSGRLNIWRVGWEMVRDNLVIGVGLQNFPSRFEDYIEPAGMKGADAVYPGRDPHSVYLSVLAELGIVGFLVLGTFALVLLYRAYSAWRSHGTSLGLLLVLLTFGYGVGTTITYRKYFWFALALAATLALNECFNTPSGHVQRILDRFWRSVRDR